MTSLREKTKLLSATLAAIQTIEKFVNEYDAEVDRDVIDSKLGTLDMLYEQYVEASIGVEVLMEDTPETKASFDKCRNEMEERYYRICDFLIANTVNSSGSANLSPVAAFAVRSPEIDLLTDGGHIFLSLNSDTRTSFLSNEKHHTLLHTSTPDDRFTQPQVTPPTENQQFTTNTGTEAIPSALLLTPTSSTTSSTTQQPLTNVLAEATSTLTPTVSPTLLSTVLIDVHGPLGTPTFDRTLLDSCAESNCTTGNVAQQLTRSCVVESCFNSRGLSDEKSTCELSELTTRDESELLQAPAGITRSEPNFKKPPQRALNSFNDDGRLRIGGRFYSSYSFPRKHPMLLPVSPPFTALLSGSVRKELHHSGPRAMTAHIRERFWSPNLRNLVRKQSKSCIHSLYRSVDPPEPCVGPPDPCVGPPDPCVGPPNSCVGMPDACIHPPNPCAEPPDPCVSPPDACVGPPDPCVGPTDPCVGPPNPCVGPPDPCIHTSNLSLLETLASGLPSPTTATHQVFLPAVECTGRHAGALEGRQRPLLRLSMGPIESVHPGEDDLVRLVTVSLASDAIDYRSALKVCLLPMDDDTRSATTPGEVPGVSDDDSAPAAN